MLNANQLVGFGGLASSLRYRNSPTYISTSALGIVAINAAGQMVGAESGGKVALLDRYGNVMYSGVSSNTTTAHVDDSGNIYLYVNGGGYNLAKLNSSGALQWTITATFPISKVAVDASGNVYTAGYYGGGGAPPFDDGFCVAKLNSSGVLQWLVGKNGIEGGNANKLIVSSSGNPVLGYQEYYGQGVIEINASTGAKVWGAGVSNSYMNVDGLCSDSSGNIFVSIPRSSDALGVISKFNSAGTLQWSKLTNVYTGSCACDTTGNVYTAASSGIAKISSAGAVSASIAMSPYWSATALSLYDSKIFAGSVIVMTDALTLTGKYGATTFSAGSVSVSAGFTFGGGQTVGSISGSVAAGSTVMTSGYVPSLSAVEIP